MKKSTKFLSLLMLSIVCVPTMANVLVLEYKKDTDDDLHGKSVEWIACKNSMHSCKLQYADDFSSRAFTQQLEKNLSISNIVNMSFTIQKPAPFNEGTASKNTERFERAKKQHEDTMAEYQRDHAAVESIIRKNPDKLFVAAAGNGIPLGPFQSSGVALKASNPLYPQVMSEPNLLKVSALDIETFDVQAPINYKIAAYSNHGLELADLAAPVEANHLGELINGSSFAAPWVSRLAEELVEHHPQLSAEELGGILLRSCDIKDISKAIWATQDLLQNGSRSIVYKGMFTRNREKRLQIQSNELSDITLVKCGGAVSQKLAFTCAQNYSLSLDKTKPALDFSCSSAHKQVTSITEGDRLALLNLWRLRGL